MRKPTYSSEQEQEIVQLLKEPDLSYSEVANLCGLKYEQVLSINYKHGVRPSRSRRSKVEMLSGRTPAAPDYDQIDQELQQLEARRQELLKQKADLEIRFTVEDGGNVSINGLNGHPLTAHYTQWLRFLRKNKAAELREFIGQKFGATAVAHA
jgi:transposase-like protein